MAMLRGLVCAAGIGGIVGTCAAAPPEPRLWPIEVDGKVESRKTAKIRAGQVVNCDDLRIRVVAGPA